MVKPKIIDIEAHAFLRMLERGAEFGLSFAETKEFVFTTVGRGVCAKRKHLSKTGITYYHYFHNNLSFYVACQEREQEQYIKSVIRTVIIEEGRE